MQEVHVFLANQPPIIPRMSHIISGSFVERDLQRGAFFAQSWCEFFYKRAANVSADEPCNSWLFCGRDSKEKGGDETRSQVVCVEVSFQK